MKEYTQRIIDKHDPEELCDYCTYGHDCLGPVTGGPNGPIFAPCVDSPLEDWFDIEAYEDREEY